MFEWPLGLCMHFSDRQGWDEHSRQRNQAPVPGQGWAELMRDPGALWQSPGCVGMEAVNSRDEGKAVGVECGTYDVLGCYSTS